MERLGLQEPTDFSLVASDTFRMAGEQNDPANARVTAHLGRSLADQALEQGTDPDEARRARGEADFLTSRAQKLAPDNDEVRKLRDEVVTLLGLKTN